MIMVMLPSIEGILYHEFGNAWIAYDDVKGQRILLAIQILPSCLLIVFSLALAFSAYHIANWVTKSTGKKRNSCLLILHFVNLFILIAATISYAIINYKCNVLGSE